MLLALRIFVRHPKKALQQYLPGVDYAIFSFALASAKQRPRTSIGGFHPAAKSP
jgi:hypothetical protein